VNLTHDGRACHLLTDRSRWFPVPEAMRPEAVDGLIVVLEATAQIHTSKVHEAAGAPIFAETTVERGAADTARAVVDGGIEAAVARAAPVDRARDAVTGVGDGD
jgi:hypothetical protein